MATLELFDWDEDRTASRDLLLAVQHFDQIQVLKEEAAALREKAEEDHDIRAMTLDYGVMSTAGVLFYFAAKNAVLEKIADRKLQQAWELQLRYAEPVDINS